MKSFTLGFCLPLIVSTSTSNIPKYVPSEGLVAAFSIPSGLTSRIGDSLAIELCGAILEKGFLDINSNDAWAEVNGLSIKSTLLSGNLLGAPRNSHKIDFPFGA